MLNHYTFLFLYFFIFHRNWRNSFVISEPNIFTHCLTVLLTIKATKIFINLLIFINLFRISDAEKIGTIYFYNIFARNLIFSMIIQCTSWDVQDTFFSCFPQSLKISLKSSTLLLILAFIHRRTLLLALRSHAAHAISISASSALLRTVDGIERKSIRFSKGLGSATRARTKC